MKRSQSRVLCRVASRVWACPCPSAWLCSCHKASSTQQQAGVWDVSRQPPHAQARTLLRCCMQAAAVACTTAPGECVLHATIGPGPNRSCRHAPAWPARDCVPEAAAPPAPRAPCSTAEECMQISRMPASEKGADKRGPGRAWQVHAPLPALGDARVPNLQCMQRVAMDRHADPIGGQVAPSPPPSPANPLSKPYTRLHCSQRSAAPLWPSPVRKGAAVAILALPGLHELLAQARLLHRLNRLALVLKHHGRP